MRGLWLVAAACLLSSALAGCTGSAEPVEPDEIVVRSPPQDVHSDGTNEEPTVSQQEKGMIVGYVVDAAIRPIKGAVVSIPGLDLKDETDRDGAFAFPDLLPSAYFLVVRSPGYVGAETTVEVPPGGMLQVRFVLDAIPPPSPRNVTKTFHGYTEITSPEILFSWCSCDFPVQVDHGVRALVIEAVMDDYQWGGTVTGDNSFTVDLGVGYTSYAFQTGPNPFLMVVPVEELNNKTSLRLRVEPNAFPLPETAKEYSVFVTSFYYSMPPDGWSFVAGGGGQPAGPGPAGSRAEVTRLR